MSFFCIDFAWSRKISGAKKAASRVMKTLIRRGGNSLNRERTMVEAMNFRVMRCACEEPDEHQPRTEDNGYKFLDFIFCLDAE
jgi:hypothetical protein